MGSNASETPASEGARPVFFFDIDNCVSCKLNMPLYLRKVLMDDDAIAISKMYDFNRFIEINALIWNSLQGA